MNAADEILGPTLAQGRGDTVAILCGDEAVGFAELNARANRFGNALAPHLGRGGRALLMLRDSPTMVAAFLGIMRVGAVAVPLNIRAAAKDLAFVLADSGAAVLLIEEELLPLYRQAAALAQGGPGLVVVRGAASDGLMSVEDLLRGASDVLPAADMASDDMAFWLYTSGTTGTPKAAIHVHGDVVQGDAYFTAFGFDAPGTRIFASSKLFFAYALGHVLIAGLRAGATIILHEGWPDAAAVAAVVERYRPTILLSVPTFYRALLREGFARQPAFRQVRTYVSAGEGLPESLYRAWREQTGAAIIDGIGATETMLMMISGTPAEHRPGATGKPMPYTQAKLLDQGGNPVTAVDTPGMLWVKIGTLCRGYWQQPDKTRAAFVDGWFRTGDMFSIDAEGWWHHQGRSDDLLKISGQWVSPAEIEECAATVPGVLEAVAVGVENDAGLTRLALFLVADRAGGGLEQAVKEQLLATLSVYKCPRTIRVVDAIPRTATGKVQRFRLRQMLGEE